MLPSDPQLGLRLEEARVKGNCTEQVSKHLKHILSGGGRGGGYYQGVKLGMTVVPLLYFLTPNDPPMKSPTVAHGCTKEMKDLQSPV